MATDPLTYDSTPAEPPDLYVLPVDDEPGVPDPLPPAWAIQEQRRRGADARTKDPAARVQWESLSPEEQLEMELRAAATLVRLEEQIDRRGPIPGMEPRGIGQRTAADLRHGQPPEQLVGVFLTPEGGTVVFGKGGVGKGMVACWFARELVRAGHVVMLLDYEGHEREWGSRLRGLGLTEDELGRIHYRAPFGSDWTAPTGPLSNVADAVRLDCEQLGITYLVVDSYTVATSNGDTMGGEQAAREYFSSLTRIGLPSLTIAHVRGDGEKFPDRPFGSVFVHNLARETWAVGRVGAEPDAGFDPDEVRYGPETVELELRNKKANGRGRAITQYLTFSFYGDGTIDVSTDGPAGRGHADLAADALAEGPMTVKEIVSAIREDTGTGIGEEAMRVTLVRHPARFVKASTGHPRKWSLA